MDMFRERDWGWSRWSRKVVLSMEVDDEFLWRYWRERRWGGGCCWRVEMDFREEDERGRKAEVSSVPPAMVTVFVFVFVGGGGGGSC